MYGQADMSGDEPAYLAESHAWDNVNYVMLLQKLCRRHDKQCRYQWEGFESHMYILRASDPDKAQPADKAVDGREEVGWLVDRIQKSRKLVAYTVSHDLRTNICRRQKYEEQKADESRHQVCTHKPKDSVRIVTVHMSDVAVAYSPEHIAITQIYKDPFGHDRNSPVKPDRQIVVVQILAQSHGYPVDRAVDDKAEYQRRDGPQGNQRIYMFF